MKKIPPISSSKELARFLFEQVGIRWQVSERPILTMHKVFNSTRQEYTVPVWLWTITMFIPNEAGQPIVGRTITEWQKQDSKPDEDTVIDLFAGYSSLAGNIWDVRHSRWYGYYHWKSNNEDTSHDSEARKLYRSEKAKVLAVRDLLGAQGFRQLIRAEV